MKYSLLCPPTPTQTREANAALTNLPGGTEGAFVTHDQYRALIEKNPRSVIAVVKRDTQKVAAYCDIFALGKSFPADDFLTGRVTERECLIPEHLLLPNQEHEAPYIYCGYIGILPAMLSKNREDRHAISNLLFCAADDRLLKFLPRQGRLYFGLATTSEGRNVLTSRGFNTLTSDNPSPDHAFYVMDCVTAEIFESKTRKRLDRRLTPDIRQMLATLAAIP